MNIRPTRYLLNIGYGCSFYDYADFSQYVEKSATITLKIWHYNACFCSKLTVARLFRYMQITAVLFRYSDFLSCWKSSLRGWGIYVQIRIDHGNLGDQQKIVPAESIVTDSCNVFVILVYASQTAT